MEAVQSHRFKKTIDLAEVLSKVRQNPLKYFEDWHLLEVRERCLKEMEQWRYIYESHAEWAEACIRDFLEQGDDYNFREKVLSWYVFAAKDGLAVRAIEFAFSLWREHKVHSPELSKLIAGRLLEGRRRDIDLYSKLPPLREFLEKLLDELKEDRRDGYFDSDWFCAERALRIIDAAGDVSFLPQIEELILLLQEGKIYPSKYDPPESRDMNLARLKYTRKSLVKARKEKLAD